MIPKGRLFAMITLILLVMAGVFSITYYAYKGFEPYCYQQLSDKQAEEMNKDFSDSFVKKEYVEVKDMGKTFLTIIVAVFVASLTFSEKIVNFQTSSLWAKSFLIICWIALLLSIVATGLGMVFMSACFDQAIHAPCPENINLFSTALLCFLAGGLLFGLGLACMLAAGIISFLYKTASPNVASSNVGWRPKNYPRRYLRQ